MGTCFSFNVEDDDTHLLSEFKRQSIFENPMYNPNALYELDDEDMFYDIDIKSSDSK